MEMSRLHRCQTCAAQVVVSLVLGGLIPPMDFVVTQADAQHDVNRHFYSVLLRTAKIHIHQGRLLPAKTELEKLPIGEMNTGVPHTASRAANMLLAEIYLKSGNLSAAREHADRVGTHFEGNSNQHTADRRDLERLLGDINLAGQNRLVAADSYKRSLRLHAKTRQSNPAWELATLTQLGLIYFELEQATTSPSHREAYRQEREAIEKQIHQLVAHSRRLFASRIIALRALDQRVEQVANYARDVGHYDWAVQEWAYLHFLYSRSGAAPGAQEYLRQAEIELELSATWIAANELILARTWLDRARQSLAQPQSGHDSPPQYGEKARSPEFELQLADTFYRHALVAVAVVRRADAAESIQRSFARYVELTERISPWSPNAERSRLHSIRLMAFYGQRQALAFARRHGLPPNGESSPGVVEADLLRVTLSLHDTLQKTLLPDDKRLMHLKLQLAGLLVQHKRYLEAIPHLEAAKMHWSEPKRSSPMQLVQALMLLADAHHSLAREGIELGLSNDPRSDALDLLRKAAATCHEHADDVDASLHISVILQLSRVAFEVGESGNLRERLQSAHDMATAQGSLRDVLLALRFKRTWHSSQMQLDNAIDAQRQIIQFKHAQLAMSLSAGHAGSAIALWDLSNENLEMAKLHLAMAAGAEDLDQMKEPLRKVRQSLDVSHRLSTMQHRSFANRQVDAMAQMTALTNNLDATHFRLTDEVDRGRVEDVRRQLQLLLIAPPRANATVPSTPHHAARARIHFQLSRLCNIQWFVKYQEGIEQRKKSIGGRSKDYNSRRREHEVRVGNYGKLVAQHNNKVRRKDRSRPPDDALRRDYERLTLEHENLQTLTAELEGEREKLTAGAAARERKLQRNLLQHLKDAREHAQLALAKLAEENQQAPAASRHLVLRYLLHCQMAAIERARLVTMRRDEGLPVATIQDKVAAHLKVAASLRSQIHAPSFSAEPSPAEYFQQQLQQTQKDQFLDEWLEKEVNKLIVEIESRNT